MLYRVLKPLSTGQQPGDLVEGGRFKRLDALLAVGALAEVKVPPLSEIPGWQLRSEKLAQAGVVTVQDFLDADKKRLAQIFRYKSSSVITKWKKELREWLNPKTTREN